MSEEEKLTAEDLDFMWEYCIRFGHPVISRLRMNSWRDLRPDLVKQIPAEYEKMVKKVVYNITKNNETIKPRKILNSRGNKST